MQTLLGVLLAALLVLGGCSAGQDSASGPAETTPGTTNQGTPNSAGVPDVTTPTAPNQPGANQPSTNQPASGQAVPDQPLPCREGVVPTTEEMFDLLAHLSTYAPLAHLTGPALELERQWIGLERTGWPSASGTWVSHGWFDMSIQSEPEKTYVVDLEHGLYVRTHDRFRVVCNEGRWQVRQHAVGVDGAWMEPARELPGQRGDLTPELALALARMAQQSEGPWSAQVLTGNALGWKRVDAIYRARGLKPLLDPWLRATNDIKLTPMAENLAEGQFLSSSLRIRLEKVDGLWKIQDFTEGGQWTAHPRDMRLTESGTVFDPPFSIQPGITNQKAVESLLGSPDSVKSDGSGSIFSYSRRQIEVKFDAQGKVTVLTMRTGAPNSGVKVGSPVELWELVYGPQAKPVQTVKQRLLYSSQDGKVTEIIYSASGK